MQNSYIQGRPAQHTAIAACSEDEKLPSRQVSLSSGPARSKPGCVHQQAGMFSFLIHADIPDIWVANTTQGF